MTPRTAAPVPSLAERERPGLSETLPGARDPRHCQKCGATHADAPPLTRWVECDPWDQVPARPVVVVLCARCSRVEIDRHPRLYRELPPLEPFPGCMSVCLDCPERDGVACRSSLAKANGGAGLTYEWKDGATPGRMYACIRPGGCRVITIWPGKVVECSGRTAARERVTLDSHARAV